MCRFSPYTKRQGYSSWVTVLTRSYNVGSMQAIYLYCMLQKLSRDVTIEDINGKPLSALTVFSQYICHLKDEAFNTVKMTSSDDVSMKDIRWVLTVPAIWSDAAKQFMREAAQDKSPISIHYSRYTTYPSHSFSYFITLYRTKLVVILATVLSQNNVFIAVYYSGDTLFEEFQCLLIQAGIERQQLFLALEPECASLYSRLLRCELCAGKMESSLRPGTKYLLLDAGGKVLELFC